MGLMAKQLTREMGRHKVFLVLLFLLSCFCVAIYFYIHFSIDGNLANLRALPSLSENQQLYERALLANTTLAQNFMLAAIGVAAVVFAMFFYRFFKKGKKQMGTPKALGFADGRLRGYFVAFTAALSLLGVLPGIIVGHFTSDVFLQANMESYSVTGLVKGVSLPTVLIGCFVPMLVFCAVAFLCYGFVRRREVGLLLAGGIQSGKTSRLLLAADKIAGVLPLRNKFPTRLALRKPIGIFILLFAVMGLLIFHIIGMSLVPSSQLIYDSQLEGHHYDYESGFAAYQDAPVEGLTALSQPAVILQN